MINPFETIDKRLSNIESLILDLKHQPEQPIKNESPDLLADFIPKNEVRGKLASASTLWKYEKEGKIQAYAIGGKRFYKRSELENALVKLNKKRGEK